MPSSGNGTDPLAHIRPGDEADDMLCKDQRGPWMCTRDLQHPGQHIASVGYGQRVGAVWPAAPDDASATAETLREAVGRYVDYGPPGPWKIRLNEALIRDQRAAVSAAPAAGQPPAQKLCFAPLPEQPSDLGNLVARCGQPYGHDGRHVPLAAPADDTAVQGWGDVESADFIERARAATAVGSFTAQFDHVYDPSGDFVCESVDHSTAVRIAAALGGAQADDAAAPVPYDDPEKET